MQKANFKKTAWQCKTKDQNFKTFYYLKRNSPIDLVPLSLKIVL